MTPDNSCASPPPLSFNQGRTPELKLMKAGCRERQMEEAARQQEQAAQEAGAGVIAASSGDDETSRISGDNGDDRPVPAEVGPRDEGTPDEAIATASVKENGAAGSKCTGRRMA